MTILEKAQELPILDMADVCVLGGGTTGVMAAVRAARMGASVVLVEQQGTLGEMQPPAWSALGTH